MGKDSIWTELKDQIYLGGDSFKAFRDFKKKKFLLFNIFFTLYIGINFIGGERGLSSHLEKKKNLPRIN